MYNPIEDGRDVRMQAVAFREVRPPDDLIHVVHSYWELKTTSRCADDFMLHALPDACVNILFNLNDPYIAGITALQTMYTTLNLGVEFHYAGVQLFPGVWQGNPQEIQNSFVVDPYTGAIDLITYNQRLQQEQADFTAQQSIFSQLVRQLCQHNIISRNPMMERILQHLDDLRCVADMAEITHLSTRHLQRLIKQATGFSPHDLLKVLRLQHALRHQHVDAYADQSHFIRSFHAITGYTPSEYYRKFHV